MPQADAIAPMANMRPRYSRSRFSTSPPMEAASYATRATEGTAARRALGRVRQALRRDPAEVGVAVAGGGPVGAERGGREALMAAERLGELRRLAVADAVRHFPHGEAAAGEQLGGPLHPHAREVLAERGVADLGVGALQLAPRGRDT